MDKRPRRMVMVAASDSSSAARDDGVECVHVASHRL